MTNLKLNLTDLLEPKSPPVKCCLGCWAEQHILQRIGPEASVSKLPMCLKTGKHYTSYNSDSHTQMYENKQTKSVIITITNHLNNFDNKDCWFNSTNYGKGDPETNKFYPERVSLNGHNHTRIFKIILIKLFYVLTCCLSNFSAFV